MKLFTKEIDNKLFAQYPKGGDLEKQKVITKIFNPYGKGRWYLLNSDPEDSDYLWAIVEMGGEVEIGSVSRSQLENIKIGPYRFPLERDIYFSPKDANEVYSGLKQGKYFKDGGEVDIAEQNKDMLLNYAEELEHHTEEFEEAAKKAENVEPWVLAKIERATTDLSDVTHYLDSENEKRREYKNGEGEEKEYKEGGIITESDVKVGSKFKNKSGTIFIVDEVKEQDLGGKKSTYVYSSIEGGSKGNYRNRIDDFVEFMNEENVTKYASGGMMADGGVLKVYKKDNQKYYWKFTFENGKEENSFDGFSTSADAQRDFQYRSKYFKMASGGKINIGTNTKTDSDVYYDRNTKSFYIYVIDGAGSRVNKLEVDSIDDVLKKFPNWKWSEAGRKEFKSEKGKMEKGGEVKFADKVKSIKSSLLKRKKVSPSVQKDYGKTYSPKEAEESAKRIVGAMTAKERLMKKRKK